MLLSVVGSCYLAVMLLMKFLRPTDISVNGTSGLSRTQEIMVPLIFLIRGAVFIKGLWHVQNLFGLFSNGQIFTGGTVRQIKSIGYSMLAYGIVPLALVVILPPSILADSELGSPGPPIVSGLVIIFISWVMDEGRKIKEEHELVI
jgi:hypothetical protein